MKWKINTLLCSRLIACMYQRLHRTCVDHWIQPALGKNNFENFVKKINPDRLKNQLRSFRQYFTSPSSSSNETFKSKLNNLTDSLVSLSQRSQFNINLASSKFNVSSEDKEVDGGNGVSSDALPVSSDNSSWRIDKSRTDLRTETITEKEDDVSLGPHSQFSRSSTDRVTKSECSKVAQVLVSDIINESRESAEKLVTQKANDTVEEILVKSLDRIESLIATKHERSTDSRFEIRMGDSVETAAGKLIEEIIFQSCKYVNQHILLECERAAKILLQEIICKSERIANERQEKNRKKKKLEEINDAWNRDHDNFKSSSSITSCTKSVKNSNKVTVLANNKMAKKISDVCIPSVFVETDSDGAVDNSVHAKPISNLELTLPLCSLTPETSPRNKSPVTVQEWVDALPLMSSESARVEDEANEGSLSFQQSHLPENLASTDNLNLGAEAQSLCGIFPNQIINESVEIDEIGSHCSSGVDSLLEARKVDPEEVLLSLGFGRAPQYADPGRIPQRFLQPSKLKGVVIDDFLRHQQELVHTFESGFCGYRGLTGPSHAAPSVIVAKIMERLREREREADYSLRRPSSTSSDKSPSVEKQPGGRFNRAARNILTKVKCTPGSVLTPDNRRWLDSQGDKSPDVPRRIIIGQRSFTFSRDGDLIESPLSSLTDSDSRWTSSTEALKPTIESDHARFLFPSIAEDQKSHEEALLEAINNSNNKHFLSDELDSGIVEGVNSPSNNITVQTSIDSFIDNISCEEKDPIVIAQKNFNNQFSIVNSSLNLSTDKNENFTPFINNYPSDYIIPSDNNGNILGGSTESTRSRNLVKTPTCVLNSFNDNNSTNSSSISKSDFDNVINNNSCNNQTNFDALERRSDDVWNINPSVVIFEPNPFDEAFQTSHNSLENSSMEEQKTDGKLDPLFGENEAYLRCPSPSSPSGPRSLHDELNSSLGNEDNSYFKDNHLKSPPEAPDSISPSPERELEELLSVVQPYNDQDPSKHDSFAESSALFDNIILNFPRKLSNFCQSLDHLIESLERIMHSTNSFEQSNDSAVESDVASTSGNIRKNKSIEHQYEELCDLGSQLKVIGVDLEIVSQEEFKALDSSQRCALQCSVVRQALNAYLTQLNSDESNAELKSCIRPEVQKVSDLLDTNEDTQKLAAIVKQMTLLLQHQAQLSQQLRDLTTSNKPLCVERYDEIFRRVRGLELLVQNNARELAEMRQRLQATSSSSNKNS